MKPDLRKEKIPFTQIANSVLTDPNLSSAAKGVYAYLYSKPDNWDFSAERMVSELKESRNTIYRVLQEIEDIGLLTRQRHADGKVSYYLSIKPTPKIEEEEKPTPKIAQYQDRPVPKSGSINNTKELTNTKEINNKESTLAVKKEIQLTKKEFFSNPIEQTEILTWLIGNGVEETRAKQEIMKFVSYWTETDDRGKERWRAQKFFDVKRRFVTWMTRANGNFNPKMERKRQWIK